MKLTKKGDLRIKTMIDWEGDYVANIQVFRGFFNGWKNVKAYYARNGRSPEECVRLARQYIADTTSLKLGVLK